MRETMKTTNGKAIRNIVIFALLVNGLAWLGPILGGTPAEPGLGFLLWGVAPLVAALVMKTVLRDDVSMGWRPNVRGNGRFYLLSLFLYPVSIAVVLGIGLLAGTTKMMSIPAAELMTAVGPLVVTYLVFAIFEEVGWRGYLAPRVYRVHRGFLGHVVVGLVWASWHFP